MDFGFSEEQEKFRQEVRNFLEEEIRQGTFTPSPIAWSEDHSPKFSKKIAKKGWIGLHWPKEYGGQGRSEVDRAILYEELMKHGAPIAYHEHCDNGEGAQMRWRGSEKQKKELLPKFLKGEICVALGANEPDRPGMDYDFKTQAVLDGDEWVINGEKSWQTHGPYANLLMVHCMVDPEAPPNERDAIFLIDPKTPGVSMRPVDVFWENGVFGHFYYDNVRVPKENILPGKSRRNLNVGRPINGVIYGEFL